MANPGLSREDMQRAVDAVREYGTVAAAAKAIGMPDPTLRNRYNAAIREGLDIPEDDLEYDRPVLHSDKPSLDDLLDHKRREFTRRQAAVASRKWMEFRVRVDGPFGLAFVGDPHMDDGGCNFPLLERDLALLRDTPGLYGVGMGDLTNNWIGRLQRLYVNQETTRSQGWMLAEWFFNQSKPSGQSVWWMHLKGNHDLWSGSSDPLDWMVRSGAPLEDWQARFVAVSGDRRWPIHAAHDFKGSSIWNPAHAPMRKGALDGQAVAYIAAHRHNWICTEVESEERAGYVYWACRARGYKFIDSYADQSGYGSQDYGATIAIVFDPDKTGPAAQRAFPDLAEAADFLTWKRARV